MTTSGSAILYNKDVDHMVKIGYINHVSEVYLYKMFQYLFWWYFILNRPINQESILGMFLGPKDSFSRQFLACYLVYYLSPFQG